jgi:hypothetical protein
MNCPCTCSETTNNLLLNFSDELNSPKKIKVSFPVSHTSHGFKGGSLLVSNNNRLNRPTANRELLNLKIVNFVTKKLQTFSSWVNWTPLAGKVEFYELHQLNFFWKWTLLPIKLNFDTNLAFTVAQLPALLLSRKSRALIQ